MDMFDVILAKKLAGGGGSSVTVESLSVTENGEYSEQGIAYSPVTVNVPQTTVEPLNATANGTYTAPSGKAYSPVEVAVPLPSNAYLLKSATAGSIVSFADGADAPLNSLKTTIEAVQSGSGDPSPSNVRPISGWSAVNVVDNRDNQWDETYTANTWLDNIDGSTASQSGYNVTGYIKVKPNTTYYKMNNRSGRNLLFDANKNALPNQSWNAIPSNATVFTTLSNAHYIRFTIRDEELSNFGFNYPSTDTEYHAYNGHSVTIQLGQTVYGGELDVTSGVLTVTHTSIASYNGESINEPWISSMDVYQSGATPTTGAQVVYPLTTPQTIQLTPTQVRSIVGQNNIFTDCGSITEAQYFSK